MAKSRQLRGRRLRTKAEAGVGFLGDVSESPPHQLGVSDFSQFWPLVKAYKVLKSAPTRVLSWQAGNGGFVLECGSDTLQASQLAGLDYTYIQCLDYYVCSTRYCKWGVAYHI